MIRKDFLVKQFEEFGKVIARILRLRREKEHDLLKNEISDAVQKFTTLEIEQVEQADADSFNKMMLNLDDQQLKMLADLLFEKMHYFLMREDEENHLCLKFKALKLYELFKAREQNEFNMEVYYKLQYLKTV